MQRLDLAERMIPKQNKLELGILVVRFHSHAILSSIWY
jgi:hypothetical protein